MKRSGAVSEPLDIEGDIPTDAVDVRRLRRLREQTQSLEQVLAATRAAGPATYAALRARGTTRGEPFEL